MRDEISADALTIVADLLRDGDRVLVLETADWCAPFDSTALVQAAFALFGRVLNELADRLAYPIGEHLRLVEPHTPPPTRSEPPPVWWLEHAWIGAGNGILIHRLDPER